MGYGARALQALNAYYSGEYFNLDESVKANALNPDTMTINEVCHSLSYQLTRSLPLISPPVFSLTILLLGQPQPCFPSYKDLLNVNPRTLTTLVYRTG
jgi:hypothetical protein